MPQMGGHYSQSFLGASMPDAASAPVKLLMAPTMARQVAAALLHVLRPLLLCPLCEAGVIDGPASMIALTQAGRAALSIRFVVAATTGRWSIWLDRVGWLDRWFPRPGFDRFQHVNARSKRSLLAARCSLDVAQLMGTRDGSRVEHGD